MSKLKQIEDKLDYLYEHDPDNPEILELEQQADECAEYFHTVNEAQRKKEQHEREQIQHKIDDIMQLHSTNNHTTMVEKYGHEFINDYCIRGTTIHSNVSDGQWTLKDDVAVNKKLRDLLYWRIYDTYVRNSSRLGLGKPL